MNSNSILENEEFSFDQWIKWSFEKYGNGNQVLNRHQFKLAVISLTGKKPKLGEQKTYTLNDLRNTVSFSLNSFVSDINQIYDEIDKEQNGYIQLKDLYSIAQKNCPSIINLLEEAFEAVDTDNDGIISYKEFISTVEKGFKSLSIGLH